MPAVQPPEFESATVEAIYDCVAEPSRWEASLDTLRRTVGGRVGVIGVIDAHTHATRLSITSGDAAIVRRLIEEYRDEVPFLSAPPKLDLDVPYTVDSLYDVLGPGTQERWLSARVTQDFIIPNALDDFFWLTLLKRPNRTGSLTIITGREKQITPEDLAYIGAMAPHVRRAITIGDLFEAERAATDAFRRLIEALAHAVIIVKEDLQVLFANEAAEALMRDGIAVSHAQGRVSFPFPHANRAIARAVRMGERDEVSLGGAGINVPVAAAECPAIAHVMPLARRDASARFAREAVAGIFICAAGVEPAPALDALAALFGLTPAEKRVAAHVAQGRARRDIAAAQGVSDGTVKSQLGVIFEKTGVRDQRHLELLIRDLTPPVRLE